MQQLELLVTSSGIHRGWLRDVKQAQDYWRQVCAASVVNSRVGLTPRRTRQIFKREGEEGVVCKYGGTDKWSGRLSAGGTQIDEVCLQVFL